MEIKHLVECIDLNETLLAYIISHNIFDKNMNSDLTI